MGILDQLRNWTPEQDNGRSDFLDDVKKAYRPRVARESIRIVKGATDLRDAMPVRVGTSPTAGMSDYANPKYDTRPFADQVGQPSEKQRALIVKLVGELMALDVELGTKAAEYTVGMTNAAKWESRKGGNASQWIGKLIEKIRETRSAHRAAPGADYPGQPSYANATPAAPAKPAYDDYDDVTDGNYAVVRAGKTHFYRITRKQGRGQYAGRTFTNIQERASEELFPVRGPWAQRKAILEAIRSAGVDASHLLYSERLTRCWHCNILLTDDTTNPYRPFGLGPVCGPKVMG